MILVDSSVWIDYFSGNDSAEADFLDKILGNYAVAIGDLILTEVLQGFRHEKDYKVAKSLLEALTLFELLGKQMAIKSADNFRKLRKKGIPIQKTADVIIGSYCVEHNLPLLFSESLNSLLRSIEGLSCAAKVCSTRGFGAEDEATTENPSPCLRLLKSVCLQLPKNAKPIINCSGASFITDTITGSNSLRPTSP